MSSSIETDQLKFIIIEEKNLFITRFAIVDFLIDLLSLKINFILNDQNV